MSTSPRVLRLPSRGRLLVCTDLQGNRADFEAMAEVFRGARAQDPDTYLVFAGDLVHGPELSEDEWGPWLGDWYRDDSIGVFEGFVRLAAEHPGHVHALLGNHEHAHVGGVKTAKFHADEAAVLEAHMGPATTARFRAWCRGLPLVAASQAGVVITHACPAVEIDDARELEVDYDLRPVPTTIEEIARVPVLGPLLWARSCPSSMARRFLEVLLGEPRGFVVYGHDVEHAGYAVAGAGEQLCLSTSFGLYGAHKRYLDVDLGRRYGSARELAEDLELRRLYPDAPDRPVWGRDGW